MFTLGFSCWEWPEVMRDIMLCHSVRGSLDTRVPSGQDPVAWGDISYDRVVRREEFSEDGSFLRSFLTRSRRGRKKLAVSMKVVVPPDLPPLPQAIEPGSLSGLFLWS